MKTYLTRCALQWWQSKTGRPYMESTPWASRGSVDSAARYSGIAVALTLYNCFSLPPKSALHHCNTACTRHITTQTRLYFAEAAN